MEVGLSSGYLGELDVGGLSAKTGWWGGSPRCALSAMHMSLMDLVRGLPRFLAASSAADLLGHGPVLGDDLFGLGGGDRGVVGVADDVGQGAVEDRPGPFGQVGGDHADRAEVVFAALDHLEVVDAGELGSVRRALSAARTKVVRSSRLPALEMGWPLRSVLPVSEALGARPVKDPKLEEVAKRLAGPMVATRAGAPISARPGRLRARPSGSTQW